MCLRTAYLYDMLFSTKLQISWLIALNINLVIHYQLFVAVNIQLNWKSIGSLLDGWKQHYMGGMQWGSKWMHALNWAKHWELCAICGIFVWHEVVQSDGKMKICKLRRDRYNMNEIINYVKAALWGHSKCLLMNAKLILHFHSSWQNTFFTTLLAYILSKS